MNTDDLLRFLRRKVLSEVHLQKIFFNHTDKTEYYKSQSREYAYKNIIDHILKNQKL